MPCNIHKSVVSANVALLILAACQAGEPGHPGKSGVEIHVAPLVLPGVARACYDLAIATFDDVVWTRGDPLRTRAGRSQLDRVTVASADGETVCSDVFGNASGGDVTYVGPCDASPAADTRPGADRPGVQNDVSIWIDGLYDPSGVDLGQWRDPCPGGCTLSFSCVENRDTLVELNLTIMREADQGFFDVVVDFDDIFCSAKLDNCDEDDDPIELLYGAGATRDWTLNFGFACSAGTDAVKTNLLYGLVTIDCGSTGVFHLDPIAEAGNAKVTVGDNTLHYGIYRGLELLDCGGGAGSCKKAYWNLAISMTDLLSFGQSCTLSFSATANDANDGFAAGLPTAPGLAYPYLDVFATLTTAGTHPAPSTATCQRHRLDALGSAVTTTYKGEVVGEPPPVMCFQFDGLASPTGAGSACDTTPCVSSNVPASGSFQLVIDSAVSTILSLRHPVTLESTAMTANVDFDANDDMTSLQAKLDAAAAHGFALTVVADTAEVPDPDCFFPGLCDPVLVSGIFTIEIQTPPELIGTSALASTWNGRFFVEHGGGSALAIDGGLGFGALVALGGGAATGTPVTIDHVVGMRVDEDTGDLVPGATFAGGMTPAEDVILAAFFDDARVPSKVLHVTGANTLWYGVSDPHLAMLWQHSGGNLMYSELPSRVHAADYNGVIDLPGAASVTHDLTATLGLSASDGWRILGSFPFQGLPEVSNSVMLVKKNPWEIKTISRITGQHSDYFGANPGQTAWAQDAVAIELSHMSLFKLTTGGEVNVGAYHLGGAGTRISPVDHVMTQISSSRRMLFSGRGCMVAIGSTHPNSVYAFPTVDGFAGEMQQIITLPEPIDAVFAGDFETTDGGGEHCAAFAVTGNGTAAAKIHLFTYHLHPANVPSAVQTFALADHYALEPGSSPYQIDRIVMALNANLGEGHQVYVVLASHIEATGGVGTLQLAPDDPSSVRAIGMLALTFTTSDAVGNDPSALALRKELGKAMVGYDDVFAMRIDDFGSHLPASPLGDVQNTIYFVDYVAGGSHVDALMLGPMPALVDADVDGCDDP